MNVKQRKILYINTAKHTGGAEISLLTLTKNLSFNQYSPFILTSIGSQLVDMAAEADIPCGSQEFAWFSRRRPWRYWQSVAGIERCVRRHRANLIHTNCDRSLRYVHALHKVTGIPYVSHVRDYVRSWFDPPQLRALNGAAFVICNSQATARICEDKGIARERIVTVYNPVDLAAFESVNMEEAARLRQQIGISSESTTVGIVGQLQTIKGHQTFVDAALSLATRNPRLDFLVVGAPPDEVNRRFGEQLKEQVAQAGCGERFHFLGHRTDIPVIMHLLDILVVPSWQEPFGRVAVEGMAAGTLVIGTEAGGLPEIITDNETGLLFPPKDTEALARAIDQAHHNPDWRITLAAAGAKSAKRFSIAAHVQNVEALYDEVLQNHSMKTL